MQVLDELYLEEAEKVGQKLATSTDHSLEAWAALLDTWTQHTIGEPRWARFERELTGATAADDELIQAAAHRYAALRSQIALLAQTRAGHDDANWDELGVLILGLILGVALQRVADPNLAIASIPHALKILTAQPPPP